MPTTNSQLRSRVFTRQTAIRLWILVVIITLIIAIYPIGIRLLRIVMVGGGFGLWLGAAFLWWRVASVRIGLATTLLLLLVIWLLPGRNIESAALGDGYIRSL